MADLAYLGGIAPREFDEMLYADSVQLARRLRRRRDADQKFQVKMLGVLVESNGSKLV